MTQGIVLIKKYENRRLYDVTNSRYVNLEDVAQILKDGFDVRVVDAPTGADITRLILTQIIVEDAKAPNSAFPLDLLRQMIVSSGKASQETALRYMKTMLDIYQDTYRAMTPAVNPFSFFTEAPAAHPVQHPVQTEPRAAAQGAPAEAPSPHAETTRPDETAELKQRVEHLEKMVASLAQPRKSAVPRARKK